ncbi:MAG TPA: immunoglobulin domain-containing protein [Dongiaceae bacterium]|nr:immunoglobulin domain-containing protein [Dongiaceae bacterium]
MPAYENYTELEFLPSAVERGLYGSFRTTKRRKPGTPGYCIVKSFKTTADDLAQGLGAEEESAWVFAAWVAQQEVAASGAPLAPIVELKREPPTEDGESEIWCERRWHSMSLRDVVAGGFRLKHSELLHIALAVVEGLRQLQEQKDRSHGRLHLANVLVGGGEDIEDYASAPVFLTDPRPVDPTRPFDQEAGDLRSLGKILYQLIEREETPRFPSGQIGRLPKWEEALEKHAEAWRGLCSRLLNPEAVPEGAFSLESLSQELQKWKADEDGIVVRTSRALREGLEPAAARLKDFSKGGARQLRRSAWGLAAAALLAGLAVVFYAGSPWIMRSPAERECDEDDEAKFDVAAFGWPPPHYQWQVNLADAPNGTGPSLTLKAPGETNLAIQVVVTSGHRSVTKSAKLTVRPVKPPIIESPLPTGPIIVPPGGETNLEVTAKGKGLLRFQWFSNSVVIPGAITQTLTLSFDSLSQTGRYRVEVRNRNPTPAPREFDVRKGPVPRRPQPPSATLVLDPESVTQGQAFTLTATATGELPLSFEWLKDGRTLTTQPNLRTNVTVYRNNAATTNDSGRYQVRVSNAGGSSTSSGKELKVHPLIRRPPPTPLEIVKQPTNTKVMAGQTVSFSVQTTGVPAPTNYTWRLNGQAVANNASAKPQTLTIENVRPNQAGTYSVVIQNGVVSLTSATATLTVLQPLQPPIITSGPSDLVVRAGRPAAFQVQASGDPLPRYQWFFNDKPFPGETNSRFQISAAWPTNAGPYFVVATNAAGAQTTKTARLDIRPTITQTIASQTNAVGSNATFTVVAISSLQMVYRWVGPGDTKPVASAPTLTLTKLKEQDRGWYTVVVSNKFGADTNAAWLEVTNRLTVSQGAETRSSQVAGSPVEIKELKPQITLWPSNQFVPVGASLTLKAEAKSNVHWHLWHNGVEKSTDPLRLDPVATNDGGLYSVWAQNGAGCSPTNKFSLWVTFTNDIGMTFVWVPNVKLFVGQTEVSRRQYERVTPPGLPNWTPGEDDLPANYITNKSMAQAFCDKLNKSNPPAGYFYRLPTAGEWCRIADVKEADTQKTLKGRYEDPKHPEGPQAVNRADCTPDECGLCDVLGNVGELAEDGRWMGLSYAIGAYKPGTLKIRQMARTLSEPASPLQSLEPPECGFRVVLSPR